MQVIGLIGYVDKYDFAINLAKTLNIMKKSVLVVDATLDRKLKYVIPALSNIGRSYVTQYNDIDFAVGFDSMHDVENYLADQSINIGLYDYIVIDIDSPKSYEFFRTRGIDKSYFFIDSSVLSVAKNKDIVKAIRIYSQQPENIEMTKVTYRDVMSRGADDYFRKEIAEYNIKWRESEFIFQHDDVDKIVDIDSQYSNIIDIKKHSKPYIMNLADMVAEIIEDVTSKEVIKAIKRRKD